MIFDHVDDCMNSHRHWWRQLKVGVKVLSYCAAAVSDSRDGAEHE